MSDVYVLGVVMIKFGLFHDRTVPDLGAEAALLALDDAGLNIGNMEAFYCGNLGQANAMVGQRILQEMDKQEFQLLIALMRVLLEPLLLERLGLPSKQVYMTWFLREGLSKWELDF